MMTCRNCKNYTPEDVGGCKVKQIVVSPEDDIRSHGANGESCGKFIRELTPEEKAQCARDVAIMDEYAALYNEGLPKWAWI